MNSSELRENAVTKIKTNIDDLTHNSDLHNVETSTSKTRHAIKMDNASFKWSVEDENVCLQDISLELAPKSLVAVVGQVGSGKSSLLSAILGEMEPLLPDENATFTQENSRAKQSTVIVNGSIAYAAQQAWIQNATLKNNILFR